MKYYLNQIKNLRDILPVLMVLLTRHDRYRPEVLDFNWKGNVVHSLLMCYYRIFWRRNGIRHGGLTYYQDSTGRRDVYVQTWFGALQFLEQEVIRKMFKLEFKPVYVEIPQLAFAYPLQQQRPQKIPYLFAIAFAEAEGAASGTSTTPSLANVEGSGSDRWLGVHLNFGSTTVSAVPALNGSNTTIISVNVSTGDGNPNISAYRLIAPTTSASTLSATLAGSVFWVLMATTYTGVNQTTSTADEDNNSSNVAPATPVTYQSTSDLNGSWMFMCAKEDSAATPISFTSPSVVRQGEDGSPINVLGDNATEINASSNGSIEINWTGGGQRLGAVWCMIRPVSASGPANMKTYNTNPTANINTMNTNPIANVKTFDTNN